MVLYIKYTQVKATFTLNHKKRTAKWKIQPPHSQTHIHTQSLWNTRNTVISTPRFPTNGDEWGHPVRIPFANSLADARTEGMLGAKWLNKSEQHCIEKKNPCN